MPSTRASMSSALAATALLLAAVPAATVALPTARSKPRLVASRLGLSRAAVRADGSAADPDVADGAAAHARGQRARINRDFTAIALPSLAALSCENLLSLVDTMWLGRLSAVQLGAAGVGISATYSLSKLFDEPLVKTSTSLVAGKEDAELRASVLSALALALALGLMQLVAFTAFTPAIVGGFGVDAASAMRAPAASYVRLRALGAPAVTLLLVTQGIFRALGDTLTPLLCTLLGNLVNCALDPILIFGCNLGCGGAAAATAVANWVTVVPLLLLLGRRLGVAERAQRRSGAPAAPATSRADLLRAARAYLSAGSLVYVRTVGKLWGYGFAARAAAKLGTAPAAAYALTFQLGVATTQLCEAVSLALLSLVSRELTRLERAVEGGLTAARTAAARAAALRARYVVTLGCVLGGGLAALLSVATWWLRGRAIGVMCSGASSGAVRALALGVMPAVLVTQVLKGLAYPANAILMGGRDWLLSAGAMWAASGLLIGAIRWGMPLLAPAGAAAVWGPAGAALSAAEQSAALDVIWRALALCFGVQALSALVRYASGTGPWRLLSKYAPLGGARDGAAGAGEGR